MLNLINENIKKIKNYIRIKFLRKYNKGIKLICIKKIFDFDLYQVSKVETVDKINFKYFYKLEGSNKIYLNKDLKENFKIC